MRRFQQVVYGVDIGKEDICKNNLGTGVAVVKFQLVAQTVTQIEKQLRYSEADYISNLGRFCCRLQTFNTSLMPWQENLIMYLYPKIFRWNIRTTYWHEFLKPS